MSDCYFDPSDEPEPPEEDYDSELDDDEYFCENDDDAYSDEF